MGSSVFTFTALSAPAVLRFYVDGVELTSQRKTLSTGAASTTVNLTGSSWGSSDGQRSLSAYLEDAAGNRSLLSVPKLVTLDTRLENTLVSMTVLTDTGSVASADPGDVVQVVFAEALSLTSGALNSSIWGSGASVASVGASLGYSNTWKITLGTGATLAGGSTLTFGSGTPVSDVAGNTGTITVTAPTDLYDQPGTPHIGSVTRDNVISASEAGSPTAITIALSNAKAGDKVNLYMDGVLVGNATVANNGDLSATITLASGAWGGDGERVLSATVQRGNGSVIYSDVDRHVYVSTQATHWSAAQSLVWFDPDNLTIGTLAGGAKGTSTNWLSSVGTENSNGTSPLVAYHDAATMQAALVVRTANGRSGLLFNGGLAENGTVLRYDTPTVRPVGDGNFYVLAASLGHGSTSYSRFWSVGGGVATGQMMTFGELQGNLNANGIGTSAQADNAAAANNWTQTGVYRTTGGAELPIYVNGQVQTAAWGNASISALTLPSNSTWLGTIGANRPGATDRTSYAGLLGDHILVTGTLTRAYRQELDLYVAYKYGTIGTTVSAVAGQTTYLLNSSANSLVLIDQALSLASSLGVGSNTVQVAGADYVSTGAGADTVLADDVTFRSLDGGQGLDSFALSSAYRNAASGSTFRLSDYVSNARGMNDAFGSTTDDTRVNANGYHKLMGFEKLDFFQAAEKQTVQLTYTDIDQLAEKDLAQGTNVASNATTSNLFMTLGANDWLDVTTSGLGNVTYGFYQDANGTAYDRKYGSENNVGTDEAYLYVRGGDDAPDFGATSTTAVAGATSVTVDFNELLGNFSGTSAQWTAVSGVTSISGWTTGTTAGKTTLTINGSFSTSNYLDITYTGTAIVDSNSDQLRYKGIVIGISTTDTIDLSSKGAATNTTLGAGYAIYGNDGKDTIIGTSWDDLLVGGAGNDSLTGGLGADTFRAIQYEGGVDTFTDFTKSQGDKIDLRGILQGTAIEGSAVVWNADGTISTASLTALNNYINISSSGTTTVVKVDDNGLAGFAAPGYQMQFQSANVVGNLGAMDLQTLINQKVILV